MFISFLVAAIGLIGFLMGLKLALWMQAIFLILATAWAWEQTSDKSGNWACQLYAICSLVIFWAGVLVGNVYYFFNFEQRHSISGVVNWLLRP